MTKSMERANKAQKILLDKGLHDLVISHHGIKPYVYVSDIMQEAFAEYEELLREAIVLISSQDRLLITWEEDFIKKAKRLIE